MANSAISLAFFKINVSDMEGALSFWRNAFGFEVRGTYDEPSFVEHIMSLPGQEAGPSLMLVKPKSDAAVSVGSAHGPIGLTCSDIVTALELALAAGGTKTMDITEVAPGVRVCLMHSPQGHEIELVQAG